MSGHAIVHRALGVPLRVHVAGAREAASPRRRAEQREAIVSLLFEATQRVWVTEDEARQGRRRSLIDDNPTAG